MASAKVVTDSTAPEGKKVLKFDATGSASGKWYTYTVTGLKKNTDYVFSAWVKGDFLSAKNEGNASIGVVAPDTGKFMYCRGQNASRDNNQIYPTAWDGEWHLRSVAFNSRDLTSVSIALYGTNSTLWVDDMALFKNGNGVKYMGKNMLSSVSFRATSADSVCKPTDCLVGDSTIDKTTYWQTGYGWRNGFLSVEQSRYAYGYSLKYTGSEDSCGLYYIKWIDVKPNTRYVFSFDMKVLKDGAGKLLLIDDRMTGPMDVAAFECDVDTYGTGWKRYTAEINPRNFTKVGIAVCDLGGSALYDNIRLFEVGDSIGNKDIYISSLTRNEKAGYGKDATVTVNATGDGLKYKWYVKDKKASAFSLSSITGKTYSVTMNATRDGREVYCVVTDKYGFSRKTATTTLSVSRKTLKITTQPKLVTYAQQNEIGKVTVKAYGDGLTYTWYIKNEGQTKYSKSSITSSTYTYKTTAATHNRRALCVVKDVWGNSVTTQTVLLRRSATIVKQPQSVTVAKNKTAYVSVGAVGDGLTYTWYIKNPGQTKYYKSSVTSYNYSCKMTSASNGRRLICYVTDKYGNKVQAVTVVMKMK